MRPFCMTIHSVWYSLMCACIRNLLMPSYFCPYTVMDHKYKALLQNIPTRHVISAMAPASEQKVQIEKLRNLDINNFFVLGTLASITGILGGKKCIIWSSDKLMLILEAAKPEYFERNFGWHAITLESGSAELSCRSCLNASVMLLRPQIDPEYRERMQLIRDKYNLTVEPQISAMFYFDLAVKSMLAIRFFLNFPRFPIFTCRWWLIAFRNIIDNGSWPLNGNYISCDEFDASTAPERSLDLRTAFVAVTEPTTYGRWHMAANSTQFNGNSYMKFHMEIRAIRLNGTVSASVSTASFGTWLSGLNNAINVTEPKLMSTLSAAVIYRVATVVVRIENHAINRKIISERSL